MRSQCQTKQTTSTVSVHQKALIFIIFLNLISDEFCQGHEDRCVVLEEGPCWELRPGNKGETDKGSGNSPMSSLARGVLRISDGKWGNFATHLEDKVPNFLCHSLTMIRHTDMFFRVL